MEEVKELTLSEKLRACADKKVERLKEKYGEGAYVPGFLRLMYSAAAALDLQEAKIYELEGQNQKLLQALAVNASCDTCKRGPSKKCPVRGECGKERSLWEFKD